MQVCGPDFDAPQQSFNTASMGLQGSSMAAAEKLISSAIEARKTSNKKIFVSYTSNLVSCGIREVLAFMCRERLVDGIISTAGGVEEDVIKCLGSTLLGDFALKGASLRKEGMNRVGNLLIPNDNYVEFETFYVPLLKEIHAEQKKTHWDTLCSPADHIRYVGQAMRSLPEEARRDSVVYWAAENDIPFFCPALTDGSMGDMIFFYNFSNPGLVVDPLLDNGRFTKIVSSEVDKPLVICLGGGLPKHYMLRELKCPKDVVLVSTGVEWDGCTSSSTLVDDVSSNLVLKNDTVVRVHGDATLLFPLMSCTSF